MLALDLFSFLFHLVKPIKVERHVSCFFVVQVEACVHKHLVMVVLILYIGHELLTDIHWHRDWKVDHQSTAKVSASLHEVLGAEMIVFIGSDVIATERGLQSVDGFTLEFVEEGHSSCGFLGPLVAESRVSVHEEGINLRHNEREDPGLFRVVRHVAAVHEDILSSAVTMEITENLQISLFGELDAHVFRCVNLWMENLAWSLPSSIEVASSKRASVVSIDDTVRIEHRNDFKDKVLSEIFCFY
jgi:hypothetical protein